MSSKRADFAWAGGLWAALVAGLLVAWSPRYWAVSVAIISISLLALCWAMVSVAKSNALPLPPITVVVFLIGLWGLVQIAFHTTLLPQVTLDASIVWATGSVAFVLGMQLTQSPAGRRFFLELMLWSLTALCWLAMFQFYFTPDRVFGIYPAEPGGVGTLLSGNQFAGLMELAAPIALWYMLDRNPAMGALCYASIIAAVVTAGSRAGVILIFSELAVLACMVLVSRHRDARSVLALLGGLALIVSLAFAIAGTDRIAARLKAKNPYAVRKELFDSTLKLIAERPLAGYGMGTWREVYPRAATFDLNLLANEAHNDWAQWTCEGGLPFVLLMAAFVVLIAPQAVRSIWGLGILSVAAHSLVDYPTREPILLFVWFALAGAARGTGGMRFIAPKQA